MPLTRFHPLVQEWFKATFEGPSPPQAAGWPKIAAGSDTLICAPTGTGKTLTAFLSSIDTLFRRAAKGDLEDRVYVLYVSPLKALSNDIQKNLQEPLRGIYAAADASGVIAPEIRVAVRTGDTPAAERQAMLKRPPHILVTTPESLFILLTSRRGAEMLRFVETVIVDEIHALARDKRGAHLAITLERLDALCLAQDGRTLRPQRVGLSATQRPIERVAEFLVGQTDDAKPRRCELVNLGHVRKIEVEVEIPGSPLEAVCSHETWGECYDRLTELIKQNRTTLIFVNTRAMCERLAARLSERIGEEYVTSHHGSLSRDQRLKAEQRLKSGELKALVATASLELGIDIGSIDLVCQIGITSTIGMMMQRVGRSGHSLKSISRGKIFALTREELMTAAALCSSVRSGLMDVLHLPDKPLDILSQQVVAASATNEWSDDELYALMRRAYNYRALDRKEFDEIVHMLAEGFSRRRGHSAALIHYDGIGKRIHGRRGARLAAITSGGAIPDTADFDVVKEPEGIRIGSLNEDFAIESTAGDIFQLGNTSWKILKVESGRVRVEDAHGQPPSIPFWLGEAPSRSDELSAEISRLRGEIEKKLHESFDAAVAWTIEATGLPHPAADQLCAYLDGTRHALGAVPTTDTIILERFFDESGGMQLILHAPFGRRVNWAWGLALRKRFCRGFNFELQAAASENALLLSLGPQHSFPLADVFHYLRSGTFEELLIQAALEAAVFPTRWRWDACRSLALLRFGGGKKVPPNLMRMRSDDLMAAVFPHAAACPENLPGDREVPDHPLVREVLKDCLHEAMDSDGLRAVFERIEGNTIKMVARDTTEPSPLAIDILTSKPYTFLDDAPLEERRTQAVVMRRGLQRRDGDEMGALDASAIDRVRAEIRPEPTSADELHDTLMMSGYLTSSEADALARFSQALVLNGRAAFVQLHPEADALLIATERLPLFEAICPDVVAKPAVNVPERERGKEWTPDSALTEVLRGRLELLGPTTAVQLAEQMGLERSTIDAALIGLETQGIAMRGRFSKGEEAIEWCDRRLLARIHRYTLDRLRREIEPVTPRDFMRFLFDWQHAAPGTQQDGSHGVRAAVAQLQGLELPAVAWERDVLPARVNNYDRKWLDDLSLSGELVWGRRFPPLPDKETKHKGNVRRTPLGLWLREQNDLWLALAPFNGDASALSSSAQEVLEHLKRRGASFFQNITREKKLLPSHAEAALGELIANGWISADGVGGLRALMLPEQSKRNNRRMLRAMVERQRLRRASQPSLFNSPSSAPASIPNLRPVPRGIASLESAGRWSLLREDGGGLFEPPSQDELVEHVARQLLRRWGVVFHRVVAREPGLPPWRDILRVYRRLEARGELRGGRFVDGFSGEQYALPEAVEHLRTIRKRPLTGKHVALSACDPLNLVGIILPGDRLKQRASTRIVFRDGMAVAVREGGKLRLLEREADATAQHEIAAALVRRAI